MFRRSGNTNMIVGMILLLLLLVIAGPGNLPRFISGIFPQFYEGIPCAWLRTAQDRGNHQSLIGRSAENPISLRVVTSPIPTDPAGSLVIQIVVTNDSLGTVPIIYNPNNVVVGDSGANGLGLIFTPPNSLTAGTPLPAGQTIAEENIRLLGPRQRCIHTEEFPAGNVLIDPSLTSGTAQVRAFYRNNTRGQVVQAQGAVATPVYTDQGLWTGFVESDSVGIPLATQ